MCQGRWAAARQLAVVGAQRPSRHGAVRQRRGVKRLDASVQQRRIYSRPAGTRVYLLCCSIRDTAFVPRHGNGSAVLACTRCTAGPRRQRREPGRRSWAGPGQVSESVPRFYFLWHRGNLNGGSQRVGGGCVLPCYPREAPALRFCLDINITGSQPVPLHL